MESSHFSKELCKKVACVLDRLRSWENAVLGVHRACRCPVPHELAHIWDTSGLSFLTESQRPLPDGQCSQNLPRSSRNGAGKLGPWHGIRLFVMSLMHFDKPSGQSRMTSPSHVSLQAWGRGSCGNMSCTCDGDEASVEHFSLTVLESKLRVPSVLSGVLL